MWPGPWCVEKNRSFGANARLGYAPGRLLGEGGSVYFVTGLHWLQATVQRGSDIGVESIRVVADHTLRPWVAGAGLEWGSLAKRVGLEVRYSAANLKFRTGADRSALGMPRIDHTFGVVHFAGGITYVLLATLAGIGYGAAYHLTGRVEASILVQFALNFAHLVHFTYPFAA